MLCDHDRKAFSDLLDELGETYGQPVSVRLKQTWWRLLADHLDLPTLHDGGDRIKLGDTEIEILHTPGHTPGSACYRLGDQVLTGDTLFVFGCGRCDLRGGDPEQMYQSLRRLGERLPGGALIRPGHNYGITPTSTMVEQLAGNPFLHFDDCAGFVEYRMHLHDREEPYRPELRPNRHPHG